MRNTRRPFQMATLPLPQRAMGNMYTASATSIGQPTLRMSRSTYTALSTYQSQRHLQTHWKPKVTYFSHILPDIRLTILVVRQLSELLAQVKDEQSYIIVRERTHRNTAESTNGRVKWWSIFQMAVLVGEGIFQVWWLKRFFEVGKSSTGRF